MTFFGSAWSFVFFIPPQRPMTDFEGFLYQILSKERMIPPTCNPSALITQATNKVQSRVDRRNNVLIFNVPESESNLKHKVQYEDSNTIVTMKQNRCR